jgi:septum formation protein
MKLILASSSLRREQVLRDAGFEFEIRAPRVDETRRAGESPRDYVLRLAEAKAQAALAFGAPAPRLGKTQSPANPAPESPQQLGEAMARARGRGAFALKTRALVIGADTVVVVEGEMLGKPAKPEEARAMLRRLSGRTHEVLTGIAVVPFLGGATLTAVETTRVTFATMSEDEIEDYVASSEPFDKAGAYAVQGRGGRFIERIEGCYFNVVGLPLARLYGLLREAGWSEQDS